MLHKIKIKITTENAAFDDGNECAEVARILRELADKVENCNDLLYTEGALTDVNGNRVGYVQTSVK